MSVVYPPGIVNNKNVILTFSTIQTSNNQQKNIFVEFVPDFVILRGYSVNIVANGDAPEIVSVSSDVVDTYQEIFFFNIGGPPVNSLNVNTNYVSLDTQFKVGKPIQGSFSFDFKSATGPSIKTQASIALHLEFVKYK